MKEAILEAKLRPRSGVIAGHAMCFMDIKSNDQATEAVIDHHYVDFRIERVNEDLPQDVAICRVDVTGFPAIHITPRVHRSFGGYSQVHL